MKKIKATNRKRQRQLRVQRVVSCDHYWCYEHRIWQARDDDQNSVAVGRYCANCGKIETSTADKWRPLPKSYVDMRTCLERNLKTLRKPTSS